MQPFKALSKTLIIFSISSDIGMALAKRRQANGWHVIGTFRQHSSDVTELENMGIKLVHADFTSRESLDHACVQIKSMVENWDEMVVAPGLLDPIGSFCDCPFDEWADSIQVNFVNQLYVVHNLFDKRMKNALIVFFAGGGTNGTADNFSAYTVSKIALVKMTELLNSEISDVRFVIVGPGWVRTKIHQQTMNATTRAGSSYDETHRRLAIDDFGEMASVLDCIDWLSNQKKEIIGGRNISVQYDGWGEEEFVDILLSNENAGKLRRHGNSLLNRNKSKQSK